MVTWCGLRNVENVYRTLKLKVFFIHFFVQLRLEVDSDKLEWVLTIVGVSQEHEGQWICTAATGQAVSVANLTLSGKLSIGNIAFKTALSFH